MINLNEEQKLVESAKKDLESFGLLYDLYVKKLYSFVYYMVQSHSETEDIVSDTFEKAMIHIQRYEYRGYSFGAWLYKIARNIVYDKGKISTTTSVDEIEQFVKDDSPSPEEEVMASESKEILEKFLLNLKEDQREVIYLRYVEQYNIKEVCEMTGKSEDSVKSLAKRGLAKLRELVQEK